MGIYGQQYIIENSTKEKDKIISNLVIIYGHLLKFLAIDDFENRLRWSGSVFSACKNIKNTHTVAWNMITSNDIQTIKQEAIIKVYYEDNTLPIDFNYYFNIIDNDFINKDIQYFKDRKKILEFLESKTDDENLKIKLRNQCYKDKR